MKCGLFDHRPVERLTFVEAVRRGLGGRPKAMPIYCKNCGKKLKMFFMEDISEQPSPQV